MILALHCLGVSMTFVYEVIFLFCYMIYVVFVRFNIMNEMAFLVTISHVLGPLFANLRKPIKKLGGFCWLAIAIAIVETLICIKFGRGKLSSV